MIWTSNYLYELHTMKDRSVWDEGDAITVLVIIMAKGDGWGISSGLLTAN
jgi:hypothetical protein